MAIIALLLCFNFRVAYRDTIQSVKDVAVPLMFSLLTASFKVGEEGNLTKYLTGAIRPWLGPIDSLLDGKIRFTGSGAGYVSRDAIPTGATGFWIPNFPLKLDVDNRDKPGYYADYSRQLSYVGLQEEVDVIQPGQLVRVSLARWWKPRDADPSFEERCYAQISGWY